MSGALAYAWGEPSCRALFKAQPADFRVIEELGYEPEGEGEHLCLQIQKTGITTRQVVQRLTRSFNVKEMAVGYAGMKDRQGICTQWFSVCLPGRSAQASATDDVSQALAPLNGDTLRVLHWAWNSRKIRLGSHQGNRFRIRLRALDDCDRQALIQRLDRIAQEGVPNYFGEQRFGRDGGNVQLAQDWFAGKYRPQRFERSLLLSAARSQVFNAALSQRVQAGNWNTLLEGDVFNLAGTGSVFVPQTWDDSLAERIAQKDIHPTGPLWGRGEPRSSAEVLAVETAVQQSCLTLCEGLERHGLQQERRALRLLPVTLEYTFVEDDGLLLAFSLPPGTYATAVLREICHYVSGEQSNINGGTTELATQLQSKQSSR